MAIMGQLAAFVNTGSQVSTAARHKEGERKKAYTSFFHQGKPVCSRTFQFLHGIGIKRLKNLMTSVKNNGLTPRVHGNTNRKPKHALSYTTTEFVVQFLFNYAACIGVARLQPNGHSTPAIKSLQTSCVESLSRSNGYSTCCCILHILSALEDSCAIHRHHEAAI